jgi:hypothetical protein
VNERQQQRGCCLFDVLIAVHIVVPRCLPGETPSKLTGALGLRRVQCSMWVCSLHLRQ